MRITILVFSYLLRWALFAYCGSVKQRRNDDGADKTLGIEPGEIICLPFLRSFNELIFITQRASEPDTMEPHLSHLYDLLVPRCLRNPLRL